MKPAVVTKKSKRRLRYFVAAVGFVLVALELMLAFNIVALYQSLIFSAYLLFNVLVDVHAWIDRYSVSKHGRKIAYPEARLIVSVILIPFWFLFSLLLGSIAPRISQDAIWIYSLAMVIVLTILALVPDYIIKERSFSKKKRIAVRRAIGVSLILIVPYVSVILILSVLGVLSHRIQSLAVLAFLPLLFFTMMLSGGIAKRDPLEEAVEGGIFWVAVTIVPFVVAVFLALPVSYQIPYICVLIIAYMSFIYWLRSVRVKNRQKRERRTSQRMNQ